MCDVGCYAAEELAKLATERNKITQTRSGAGGHVADEQQDFNSFSINTKGWIVRAVAPSNTFPISLGIKKSGTISRLE